MISDTTASIRYSYFYDEDNSDFPSWVPRWDLGDRLFPHINDLEKTNPTEKWYAGSKKTQLVRTRCDSRIVSLKGVRLGVVLWTSNALVDLASRWVTIGTLWDQLGSTIEPSEYGGSITKDDFARAITAGESFGRDKTSFDHEDLEHYLVLRKAGGKYAEDTSKEKTIEFVVNTKKLVFLLWADNYSPGYYCGVVPCQLAESRASASTA
jgi:hypothetical protein